MRVFWVTLLLVLPFTLWGNFVYETRIDSAGVKNARGNSELFYDSLAVKASRHKLTRLLYNWMVCSVQENSGSELVSYEYYRTYEGKTIGSITIKSLEVFGPDLFDTTKTARLWIEKTANKLHSKSNLNVIRKNLWLKEGQPVDPNLLMDNERLLRSLPYLKDVRFILKTRAGNDQLVDLEIITQDVFSFGVSGSVSNIHNGDIGIYDKNILGVGHEMGTRLVGHTDKTPHIGFEAYYSVNNFEGNFVNFSTGYANTYLREGFFVSLDRDFLRPQSVYAGGLSFYRNFRSDRIALNDNVLTDFPLDYLFVDSWYGRRLKTRINSGDNRFQTTLSGRVRYVHFNDRPAPSSPTDQFYANSTMYMGSISFSHRSYIRDHLIYSYGITEDIPKGYLYELVGGFDHNEFGDRWYSHVFLSSGNIFRNKPFYFYTSVGLGTFWKKSQAEQGMFDVKVNFISPLFNLWNTRARQFIRLNYSLGINRFEPEYLLLRNTGGIRGFGSRTEKGKQRLTLNVENVFFQKRSFLNFQTAFFSFFDAGIVGPTDESIFKQSYFAGLGLGLRIRNENLVFKTIQIRLAFYPNHPSDVSSIGFIMDEVSKNRFYSFQPRGPEPLRFE